MILDLFRNFINFYSSLHSIRPSWFSSILIQQKIFLPSSSRKPTSPRILCKNPHLTARVIVSRNSFKILDRDVCNRYIRHLIFEHVLPRSTRHYLIIQRCLQWNNGRICQKVHNLFILHKLHFTFSLAFGRLFLLQLHDSVQGTLWMWEFQHT